MVVAIASFVSAVVLLNIAKPWAFFSLPTRAWELALGAILAVIEGSLSRFTKGFANLLVWIGLVLVVLSGVLMKETAAFPGLAALAPTVGVALVIIGGTRPDLGWPSRALGTRPLRFFGRISYSLYLWHWPILVLPLAVSTTPLPLMERLLLLVLTVVLATGTQRWVEDPLRRGKIIGTVPRRNLVMAGALALIVAGASLGVSAHSSAQLRGAENASALINQDFLSDQQATKSPTPTVSAQPFVRLPSPDGPVPKNLRPSLGLAKTDRALSYFDRCHTQQDLPTSTAPSLYGDVGAAKTVVLFGDSHALSWFPAVNRAAKQMGWQLLSLTMSACSPADIPAWNPSYQREMMNCATWRNSTIQRIVNAHPDLVLVTGTKGFATINSSGHVLTGAARTAAWHVGLTRTIDQLKAGTGQVVLIADTPASLVDPPVCLSAHPKSILACATPVDQAIQSDWLKGEQALVDQENIPLIDAGTWVCPTSPCPVVIGNVLIYSDGGHLTA